MGASEDSSLLPGALHRADEGSEVTLSTPGSYFSSYLYQIFPYAIVWAPAHTCALTWANTHLHSACCGKYHTQLLSLHFNLVLTFWREKVEITWQKSNYPFISATNHRDCFVRQSGALRRDEALLETYFIWIVLYLCLKYPKLNT